VNPVNVNRILFVGTGGGNDIFSTFVAVASLWTEGWRWTACDIAGVISPFHTHTVVPTDIPGVFLTTPNTTRHLLSKAGPGKSINFVDAKVAEIVAQSHPYKMSSVLALSVEQGSVGLTAAFAQLSKEYDIIVLVDAGGDCFYSGADDKHILSPMFDSMIVRAFVDSGAKGVLFEVGPGTDGELEPDSLTRALVANGGMENAKPLRSRVMNWWEEQYSKWIEPYRPGRTVPITLQAFRSAELFLQMDYRARAHFGGTHRYKYFTQTISTELCKKFYLVDPSRIKNPFAVSCASPVEWFLKTQVACRHTNNEANLEYIKMSNGELWQFLTPSPLLGTKDREELINLGLQNLSQGVNDGAWIMPWDWRFHRSSYWESQFAVSTATESNLLVCRR